MNELAQSLYLTKTHYVNAHGLSNKYNVSTAQDQVLLCKQAMQNKLFRQIVSTKEYKCTISNKGEAREAVWANTNVLLGIQGYTGLKTGWTPNADGCLAVSFRYKHQRKVYNFISVVLGSSDQETRFMDTRSLIQWSTKNI